MGRLAALGRRGARDNTGRQGPDARAGPARCADAQRRGRVWGKG